MALVIFINALLCFGIIVMVVAPLVWAIFTQHQDLPAVKAEAIRVRRAKEARRPTPRRSPAPRYQPAIWPT